MNKIKSIALLSLGCLFLSSCYINRPVKAEETVRTITVSGSGNVTLNPDVVTLKFIVRTMDWNVARSVEKNAVNTANVFAALKEVGVADSDISTSDYQITQDNTKDYPGQYTVRNTIAVYIRNTELTGKVIDAAVKGNVGANGLTSFDYSVTDKTSALRQARTLAIQDAQDAAALLAGASGCKISRVLNIHEDYTTTRNAGEYMMAKVARSDSVPTTIETGAVTVSSNVTITYELEN